MRQFVAQNTVCRVIRVYHRWLIRWNVVEQKERQTTIIIICNIELGAFVCVFTWPENSFNSASRRKHTSIQLANHATFYGQFGRESIKSTQKLRHYLPWSNNLRATQALTFTPVRHLQYFLMEIIMHTHTQIHAKRLTECRYSKMNEACANIDIFC